MQQSLTNLNRVSEFLSDYIMVGTLKGFRHFDLELVSREEMLLRVWQTEEHETTSPDTLYIVRNYVEKECISYRTRQSVLYQVGSEQLLSGNSEDDSEERRRRQRSKCYLIAAYPVYQCPYVWTVDEQEGENGGGGGGGGLPYWKPEMKQRKPLQLQSTIQWRQEDIRCWDIIVELVALTITKESNPLEIDAGYLRKIPLEESILLSGALIDFLQTFTTKMKYVFHDKVMEDLRKLQKMHFLDIDELVTEMPDLMEGGGGGGGGGQQPQQDYY